MATRAKTPEENGLEGRTQALQAAISQIERRYGKGSIMRMGEDAAVPVAVVPTGSLSLDLALGVGGVPRGRIVEIYGNEGSGKTTLAQHVVAEAQKLGGTAAFVDAEHAFDPAYAAKCGVNIEDLLVSQPDNGEQALEIAEMLVRSNAVDVIVVDSVAALVPKAEIEGEMGDAHMGLQARLMSQALRKLTSAINRSRSVVIFINQVREKIGVVFGNPETTPGGRALRFYSSVRIDVRRIDYVKSGQEQVGIRVRAKVVKNKVAPPFQTCEFDILFEEGISKLGDLIDLSTEYGIVRKAGAHSSHGDTRLGLGRENVRTFLKENTDIAEEIELAVRTEAQATLVATPTGDVAEAAAGTKTG
ncbi:MAG: recombinase RecA [Chloroflexota bacterium]|nr:recombinase RecA [Chloroflexota bacterium]